MAKIFDFPPQEQRNWAIWENAVRENCKGAYSNDVIDAALPAIEEHWQAIFEVVDVRAAQTVPIPLPLTEAQVSAIRATIDVHVQAVVDLNRSERCKALSRLIVVELELASWRESGPDVTR